MGKWFKLGQEKKNENEKKKNWTNNDNYSFITDAIFHSKDERLSLRISLMQMMKENSM